MSVGVHQGLNGPFSVLGLVDPDEPTISYVENAVGTTHVHKDAEVREYQLVFDRLRSQALSPRDSVALIERLVTEL